MKIYDYLPFFLIPFCLSLILTPVVRAIALKFGLIAQPRADRWHKKPTALMGGIAIYTATVIPALFLYHGFSKNISGLLIGGAFLFLTGILDDKFHFPPYTKLFAQIVAASIALLAGSTINLPLGIPIDIPLTMLWIIGITNSFNLLDNIDGLAAGIAAICSGMLFFSSLLTGNNPLGIYGLAICGAALGFLPYNFNPARIFMGDSGSMFLGYSLAVISIGGAESIQHISNLFTTLFIPVLILSVPIFDTLFVMLVRKLRGRRIFQGGKDHTSHRLVTLGLSQKKTVLVLYLASILFGSIGLLYSRIDIFVISLIAFLGILVLLLFGLFLFEFSQAPSEEEKARITEKIQKLKSEKTVLNNIILYKRRAIEVILDLALICISYYSAFLLRFEGSSLLKGNLPLLKSSLPWIILIKMSAFFIFGLYRDVWKYASVPDFLRIFKVVGIASIASVIFVTFTARFEDYSRAVFFIDWLLMLLLVTGSRFMFRIINEFFTSAQYGETKILIFGAGDAGEMLVREIKRNKSLNYRPVGFIDDNPYKTGNKIQGIPVLGGREEMYRLISQYSIQEIIVAAPSMEASRFSDIARICREAGIPYKRFRGVLEEERPDGFKEN